MTSAHSHSVGTETSALTIECLKQMVRDFESERKAQCAVIFTWSLAPQDGVLKFTAPVDDKALLEWLGPYAADIIEELEGARSNDYVLIVNPVALDKLCQPEPSATASRPFGLTGFMGIPVRELRRDPTWVAPPVFFTTDWSRVNA